MTKVSLQLVFHFLIFRLTPLEAFGVGSMIYSGLEFAQYFETVPGSECHNILMAATPAVRMAFTFIQMYFIFLNAKVDFSYYT